MFEAFCGASSETTLTLTTWTRDTPRYKPGHWLAMTCSNPIMCHCSAVQSPAEEFPHTPAACANSSAKAITHKKGSISGDMRRSATRLSPSRRCATSIVPEGKLRTQGTLLHPPSYRSCSPSTPSKPSKLVRSTERLQRCSSEVAGRVGHIGSILGPFLGLF